MKSRNIHCGFIKIFIIVVALSNLAISKVYINDILKVNQQLTGLTLFAFILSSLISAFNAFKLHEGSKVGIIRNVLIIIIVLTSSTTLIIQIYSCIGKQANLTKITDLKSIFILVGFNLVYLFIIVVLTIRLLESYYASKN